MASRISFDPTVQDAIQAGEDDFLHSFQQLCAISKLENHSSPGLLTTALKRKIELRPPRKLSPWAYLGYFLIGSQHISEIHRNQIDTASLTAEINRDQESEEIIDFGDQSRAPQELWQAALEHFQEGGDFVSGLEAPDPALSDSARQFIRKSRDLIQRIDPELFELMRQLQHLVILAVPDHQSRLRGESFGGATCFFFRGATIINAAQYCSLPAITGQLIHEYAHAELFVLSQNEGLCLNGDNELHKVLIRSDPRPMNGILHSLYVVARVSEWTHKLLAAINQEACRAAMADEWEAILQRQLAYGISSLKCIKKNGKLTDRGREIVNISVQRLRLAAAI